MRGLCVRGGRKSRGRAETRTLSYLILPTGSVSTMAINWARTAMAAGVNELLIGEHLPLNSYFLLPASHFLGMITQAADEFLLLTSYFSRHTSSCYLLLTYVLTGTIKRTARPCLLLT